MSAFDDLYRKLQALKRTKPARCRATLTGAPGAARSTGSRPQLFLKSLKLKSYTGSKK